MARSKNFQTELVSRQDAAVELDELRSKTMAWRKSKFDPLKQHIQWLDRNKVLRVDDMSKNDVANLRSYIERNITPVDKDINFVVRSTKVDEKGESYRVFISMEKAK